MKAELIDYMGTDLTVVNAARVSMDKESEWEYPAAHDIFDQEVLKQADAKLIKYLAKHNHFTPFTHCTITLRETVPIFVARQRFKHVVGFTYNEVSRRYVDDTPEFYTPQVWRTKPIGSIKQGSGTEKLPPPNFVEGECRACSKSLYESYRPQGGGRQPIYCSDSCKFSYSNKNRNPYKVIWNNASSRAKREGKEWSIDFDTFDFPTHCPLLEIELDYSLGKGKTQDNSPSFDRLDSSKEYVPGNVWLISNKANSMKSNSNNTELLKLTKNLLLRTEGMVVKEALSYEGLIEKAKALYTNMIEEGYSAEQARMVLPQSMYTSYYVTGSLHAFARAYLLRSDPHAQIEIQELAKMWDKVIRPLFPVSWSCLVGPT